MKRRNFLLATASGLAVVANPEHVFAKALAQAPLPGLPGGSDRCLVVVNLAGGNDGLNCVVPHGDEQYYRVRPGLAIARGDVLTIDASVGLNPGMRSLKALYDRGMVAIIQGVGYPDPDHSHFRSTEIWQTAAPDRYEHTGWLGRYFDDASLSRDNLFKGVAVSRVLPEVLVSDRTDIPAIPALDQYAMAADRNALASKAFWAGSRDRRLPFDSPYLAHVMEVEGNAQRSSEELPRLVAGYVAKASYPATPLGRSLALAAQIVGSNLGTKAIYVEHGSFDTHVNQVATQNRLLAQFSDAIGAFYQDLAAHGNDRRVLTLTFSEFGRRIEENGSRGTDHGEASPLFLIGGGVKGGLYGTLPDLRSTNMGNVRYTVDFRSVYATVLERWLGRPSATVLGGSFQKLPVLA
ncbi:MAG: DUF1501 domain-containing protein [Candidatus Eremiobacteraeota bacterium]|nr:DUF1501 domain-containing protein [Candidatus Eremiobacteraeota bacterium]MBV8498944.1 DUF1501 domain-containing protein [Candidatus Eremiobacteraeota bacterium]